MWFGGGGGAKTGRGKSYTKSLKQARYRKEYRARKAAG